MSLMGTLAKVAIGLAVAKGAGKLLKGDRGQVGDGGMFGGRHSPGASESTGLEDVMRDVFSGGDSRSSSGGGLGGLLEGLQRNNPSTRDGGLDDLFGELSSGSQQGGGLGSLIESLSGGAQQSGGGGLGGLLGGLVTAASGGQRGGDFGGMLNDAMQRRGEPPQAPTQEQDAAAGLMLRAMIQAAKSDGKFDDEEQRKLLANLGDVSAEERDFVNRELRAPVDVKGLAREVPRGLEQQVYAMSLLGIDLDNRNEAQYLHDLATEFRMDRDTVNAIHDQMGVPSIYG